MIEYYYASIVDRNLYIDGINFLDYLDKYFPNIYRYYQEKVIKCNIVDFDRYKNTRIAFNKKN